VEVCVKPRGGGNNCYYPGMFEWGNFSVLNGGDVWLNV
jgi:hypothetical protein